MAKSKQSRKGKKAWVKNVDVDDVDQALDAKREREILLGADEDFVIDTQGDSRNKKQKVLRTTEILRNKSKVPALGERIQKKPLLKKRTNELMTLAGRQLSGNKFKATVNREGILRASSEDLWTEDISAEPQVPVVSQSQPSISNTPATRAPKTLLQKPLALTNPTARDLKEFEDGGKSYNPALEDWKSLIEHEFGNESTEELKRQKMEEHKERIRYLIETLEDNEVQDLDESVEDTEPVVENEEDKYRLSINPRTEIKTKTKTQRNKEERHKKRTELQGKIRDLKAKLSEIENLQQIQEEVEQKLNEDKPQRVKTYTRHGKHDVTFAPIEVKLSDELTGNLRSLKPEGNLLYDTMHKLEMGGKVELRVPHIRKKRFRPRIVEKRSYRDL
ncbi:hypothetical protein PUMCH_003504 [Australozyma saopauloensis]|uniref:Ribosome biogenesis protein NOP53 n=1 Tax=Australozyma saopauloensis TaxID=291208 RepID=A0AAX4HCB5_9ASCO|nr:hypothetical protein PUMCH_003504 [[Candida] saopauloensis]